MWKVLALRMTFLSCQNLMSSKLKSNGLLLCQYWREGWKLLSEFTSLLSWALKRTFVESVIIKFNPEKCNGKVLKAVTHPPTSPGHHDFGIACWWGFLWSEAHHMHLCHVTVLVSSFLFTRNYKNLHTKSSDITFTHPDNIYLLNICCLPDTIPGLSHRTVGAESSYASNGTDQQ